MTRHIFLALALAVAALPSLAQDKYVYPIGHVPAAIDAYHDAAYYSAGGRTFNLQDFAVSKSDSVACFRINPDGSTLAVITTGKNRSVHALDLYNLWEQNKRIAGVKKLPYTPTAMCYTGDGRSIIVADAEGSLHFYDARNLTAHNVLNAGPGTSVLASTPDGTLLAAATGAGVAIFDLGSFTRRGTIDTKARVNDISASGDSKQLAVLTADGVLTVYNTATLASERTIDALGLATACSFNPEGKHIAVATGPSRIAVLNLLNSREREFIDADGSGVKFVRFVTVDPDKGVYLMYNTSGSMVYLDMNHLSPLRSQLIADRLKERMDEWSQQLPGESLEDYQLRVNESTRLEQMKLFEQEIATEIALDELGLAQMQLGSYNPDMQLMAIDLGGELGDIFLTVPQDELGAFLDPGNLEFQNVRYGINDQDEFQLLYADIYNTATGKTYTYNNLDGQFIDYIVDESKFAPLEIANQAYLEETLLGDLTTAVMDEAKEQNILSDHTHITVATNIVPSTNAAGQPIRNYEVDVTYTVDKDFSAKEDYGGGKYLIQDSPAGLAMLRIVKNALDSEFAKYLQPGKEVIVAISGAADATPIKRVIPYNGAYSDFVGESILLNGEPSEITVTRHTGISTNEQLAFLRAVGVKDYLFKTVSQLDDMRSDVIYDIIVSDKTGSEYRKVSVKFTFIDAF